MSSGEGKFRQKCQKVDEIENFEEIKFLMNLTVKIKENHQIKLQN